MNYIESHFENMLSGKKIIVASSASISIYRIPDLIRDLKREGASVVSAMSQQAVSMIGQTMKIGSGSPFSEIITFFLSRTCFSNALDIRINMH